MLSLFNRIVLHFIGIIVEGTLFYNCHIRQQSHCHTLHPSPIHFTCLYLSKPLSSILLPGLLHSPSRALHPMFLHVAPYILHFSLLHPPLTSSFHVFPIAPSTSFYHYNYHHQIHSYTNIQ